MKTRRLIWVRHGEAQPSSSTGDFARSLTSQGQQQVQRLGQKLCDSGWIPQVIFCSAAQRTLETAQGLLQTFPVPCPIFPHNSLYLGNLSSVEQIFLTDDIDCYDTVMLVGHNPGWSMAAQYLSGSLISLGTADAALLSTQADTWISAIQMARSCKLETILKHQE